MSEMSGKLRLFYALAILLAVFVYFYGLDGQNIPKNGDEYPYAHITRMTAESHHWLPLQSQLDNMRNTKPPLLFWQGMLTTGGGKNWSLWNLRYPSAVYTLMTAGLVFLLARRLSGDLKTAFTAFLIYLAFFSTYRYGRPFLVNPAEVFWLFLPFFTLLYWRGAFESRFLAPGLFGIAIGVGLLYKSFALVVPVGAALALWYLKRREYRWREFLRQDALKIVIVAIVALGLFGLWFLFDPDPQSVWREFVVGENAGKFDPHEGSYIAKLLWGGGSVWAMLLAYPMNAGLLAIPVAAVCVISWRRRAGLGEAEKMLWLWAIVFLVVFTLPNQRSARYLLEAMPGIAVLAALNWQFVNRKAFVASLLMTGAVLAFIAFIALRLQHVAGSLYGPLYWGLLVLTGALILVSFAIPKLAAPHASIAVLLVYGCFAGLLAPFDGSLGSYSAAAQDFARGRDVWVPCDFRAKDEGYRFVLPGARVHGYDVAAGDGVQALMQRFSLFVVQLPLDAVPCAQCEIVGDRYDIRGRQGEDELKDMLAGNVFEHLFVREYLIASPSAGFAGRVAQGCR